MILLSRGCPNEMRFDSHFGTRATSLSLIDAPSARAIRTVPTHFDRMTCPPAVVKSHVFGCIFPTKRLRSLVRCQNAQESRYQVARVLDIIDDSVVLSALPGRNGSGSEFSSSRLVAAFACHGLGLGESLSRSCLVLLLLFFLSG